MRHVIGRVGPGVGGDRTDQADSPVVERAEGRDVSGDARRTKSSLVGWSLMTVTSDRIAVDVQKNWPLGGIEWRDYAENP